ncbi:MAG: FIST C-terminal domain-containing protein [Desulfobulbus sp.]|uniref:FIST C-terminal domain-containing protein n=1 Tax=Desulfobulbus sp. TaxID=895 RepID=UPI00284E476F|nr:FIST N-terminal domain-containing protein [Desulfobulbus sp.]MDR2551003.1 FIST C-terminal domain-containing protein [Desulfobulbus sp.]
MRSATAISHEVDDVFQTARELADSIQKQLVLRQHSLGLVFCDADTDGAALTGELQTLLGMEIAGMTTLAALSPQGRHEAAIVLTVLTADDCLFAPGVSASLKADDFQDRITRTYQATVPPGSDQGPGVILTFCPFGLPFSGDHYPAVLSRVANNAPVMGGVASDDYDYERARVFLSGKEYQDAMVLVSLWGNVRPVFAIRHVTSRFAERIRRVTEAENNIVRKVGEETFVEYLQGFGLKTDVDDPLLAFNSYPMMLRQEDGDETPIMRHISGLNRADGSGSFVGDVPVGAQANICMINKADIVAACRESMLALLNEGRAQSDYTYSTILCISCCGRSMILSGDAGEEGRILAEMLPTGLTLGGAYCLGEICPTRYKNGHATNRFHNCSIIFCML